MKKSQKRACCDISLNFRIFAGMGIEGGLHWVWNSEIIWRLHIWEWIYQSLAIWNSVWSWIRWLFMNFTAIITEIFTQNQGFLPFKDISFWQRTVQESISPLPGKLWKNSELLVEKGRNRRLPLVWDVCMMLWAAWFWKATAVNVSLRNAPCGRTDRSCSWNNRRFAAISGCDGQGISIYDGVYSNDG